MSLEIAVLGRRGGKALLLRQRRDANILSCNPWEMDDSGYRVLSNKMLITRHSHGCAICFEDIPAGDRVRAPSEVLDGKAMTFYFCTVCCGAMLANATTDRSGEKLMARYDIGRNNAEAKRKVAAA